MGEKERRRPFREEEEEEERPRRPFQEEEEEEERPRRPFREEEEDDDEEEQEGKKAHLQAPSHVPRNPVASSAGPHGGHRDELGEPGLHRSQALAQPASCRLPAPERISQPAGLFRYLPAAELARLDAGDRESTDKLRPDNLGHEMLSHMGGAEGEGLGNGTGIVNPVQAGRPQRAGSCPGLGLGTETGTDLGWWRDVRRVLPAEGRAVSPGCSPHGQSRSAGRRTSLMCTSSA